MKIGDIEVQGNVGLRSILAKYHHIPNLAEKGFSDRRVEVVRTGDVTDAWYALLGLHEDCEVSYTHYSDNYTDGELAQMGIDAWGADAIFKERFPRFLTR